MTRPCPHKAKFKKANISSLPRSGSLSAQTPGGACSDFFRKSLKKADCSCTDADWDSGFA
eukprot:3051351-Amphidinium_carterae.1